MVASKKLKDARQERYCHEYIIDLIQTQAALRAGYAKRSARQTASALMTKPNIMARIAYLQAEACSKVLITPENVLESIMDIRESATTKMAMTSKLTGEKLGETMIDYNAGLKANELLGKHLALFTEKIEHSGNLDTTINIIPASKK